MSAGKATSPLVLVARVLAGLAMIAYPVVVWLGLSGLAGDTSPRIIALVLLAVIGPVVFLRLRRSKRGSVAGLAVVPLITVGALTAAAVLDAAGWMLAIPVAISVVMLVAFGSTLRAGSMPMIERFARLQEPDLTPEQMQWCRTWTWIWCAFFVLNGSTATALALWGPLDWWAFYNGLIAYALIGVLLLSEWLLRRRRFPTTADREDHA